MGYNRRDNKDPMPTADNSQRQGGGNEPYPSGAEKHDQSKAMKVGADANRTTGPTAMAVTQPVRQGEAGNTPVEGTATGESHDQKKASKIPASARW
jgi:hypothetical protein